MAKDLEKPKAVVEKLEDSFRREGRRDKALAAAKSLPNFRVSNSGTITVVKPKGRPQ